MPYYVNVSRGLLESETRLIPNLASEANRVLFFRDHDETLDRMRAKFLRRA